MRVLLVSVAGLLVLVLGMAAVWAGCSTFLKDNQAYERGLETALADSTVQTLLGAPVREGWFINGTIEGTGPLSRGSWTTRLRGSDRSGTLLIGGFKRESQWGVISLTLEVDDTVYTFRPGLGFRREDTEAVPSYDIL